VTEQQTIGCTTTGPLTEQKTMGQTTRDQATTNNTTETYATINHKNDIPLLKLSNKLKFLN